MPFMLLIGVMRNLFSALSRPRPALVITLLWIGVKLMVPEDDHDGDNVKSSASLWGAVQTIIIADVVMSLDNVIAIVAAVSHREFAALSLEDIGKKLVTVEGDRAAARAYVDALILAQDNATGVQAAGFYDDELVRTDAGWRIARRRFTTVRVVPV